MPWQCPLQRATGYHCLGVGGCGVYSPCVSDVRIRGLYYILYLFFDFIIVLCLYGTVTNKLQEIPVFASFLCHLRDSHTSEGPGGIIGALWWESRGRTTPDHPSFPFLVQIQTILQVKGKDANLTERRKPGAYKSPHLYQREGSHISATREIQDRVRQQMLVVPSPVGNYEEYNCSMIKTPSCDADRAPLCDCAGSRWWRILCKEFSIRKGEDEKEGRTGIRSRWRTYL